MLTVEQTIILEKSIQNERESTIRDLIMICENELKRRRDEWIKDNYSYCSEKRKKSQ